MVDKVCVDASVMFSKLGRMIPTAIRWEDGKIYPVDRVLEARVADRATTGISGMRYVCIIGRKKVNIYYESFENTWCVERKRA